MSSIVSYLRHFDYAETVLSAFAFACFASILYVFFDAWLF